MKLSVRLPYDREILNADQINVRSALRCDDRKRRPKMTACQRERSFIRTLETIRGFFPSDDQEKKSAIMAEISPAWHCHS